MNKRFYNFGKFRLDTHNQHLLRDGEAITLTLKQFELLLALVENAGDVVTKDQLFEQVWKDVAVADETLTRNISWLRQKLGDGEFIETVPKRGYRFAADVTTSDQPEIFVEETTLTRVRVEEMIQLSEPPASAGGITLDNKNFTPMLEPSANAGGSDKTWLALAFAIIAVAAIGFIVYQNYFSRTNAEINFAANVKPFSGAQGREDTPAFSPDGKQLTFSWNGGERENSDIYVQIIGAGKPVCLTDTEVQEQYPVFSPDGTQIAFHVRDGENKHVYVASVEGGEPRLLTAGANNDTFPAWSANGKYIYFASDRTGENQIWRVPASGGDALQIMRDGGFESSASADGKWIYYIKNSSDVGLWRVSAAVTFKNSDEAQISRVNNEGFQNAWALAGMGIYFIARADHAPYKIKFYDPSTERISEVAETDKFSSSGFSGMTVSPDGKTIVFAEFNQNASNIILAEINQ